MNKDVLKMIQDFNNDPDIQKLQRYYNRTTCMSVFNIERQENPHSSFLAWLFNDRSSHNLGTEPLRKLLTLYAICEDDASKKEGNKLNPELRKKLIVGKNYDLTVREICTEKSLTSFCPNFKEGRIDVFVRLNVSWSSSNGSNIQPITLCVENKVYSKESKGQTISYDEALRNPQSSTKDDFIMEFFLTSDHKKASCEEFVSISYQMLLDSVIQPLTIMNMPDNAALYISDYIRNLGRTDDDPSEDVRHNYKANSILAISIEELNVLKKIADRHKSLFFYALVSSQVDKDILGDGTDDALMTKDAYTQFRAELKDDDTELLKDYWDANEDLFKAIIYAEKPQNPILRESNRDKSKYIVRYGNQVLNSLDKGEYIPSTKTEAAFFIFKAWTNYYKKNNNTFPSLEKLRETFPVEINPYYKNKRFFRHLFYYYRPNGDYIYDPEPNAENPPLDNSKILQWDIYSEESHVLELSGGKKAIALRMWRKDAFDKLQEKIKSEYRNIIEVERVK